MLLYRKENLMEEKIYNLFLKHCVKINFVIDLNFVCKLMIYLKKRTNYLSNIIKTNPQVRLVQILQRLLADLNQSGRLISNKPDSTKDNKFSETIPS